MRPNLDVGVVEGPAIVQARFGALDTLRGLAAIAVVVFHLGQVKLSGDLVPHAYLAVDLFFMLSGFVIALTFEDKLKGGMSVSAFLTRRAIRLYPMAMFAVCLGAVVLLVKSHVDPTRVDPLGRILAGTLVNLALVPDVFTGPASKGVLFPGNGPLWSIWVEIVVNIVWCVALARVSTRALAIVVGASLLLTGAAIVDANTANFGFDWQTLPGGLARVLYGFGLGVLIFRLRHRLLAVRRLSFKIVSAVLLVGLLAAPRFGALDGIWDIACIGFLVPLVVLLALNGADHPRLDAALGTMSYPLYTIHFPVLEIASGLHQKMPHLDLHWMIAGSAVAIASMTFVAIKLYDEPVRRVLTACWRAGTPHKEPGGTQASPIIAGGLAV